MSTNQFRLPYDPGRTIRKLFLSAFVVFTFAAYVIHERLTRTDSAPVAAATSPALSSAGGVLGAPLPAAPAGGMAAVSNYKNGTFQGQTVDAYYGLCKCR
jgi:hypothetical protein